jgi:type IV pilus assembly protein PilA
MKDEGGFTLTELLVVMLLLSLLAAIAIPAFLNQRVKAQDSEAKSFARSAATAMETYGTDHGGRYNAATPIALAAIETTIDVGALTVDSAVDDTYRLTVVSDAGNTFTIEREADGSHAYECAAPATGGCPAGGDWG